MTSSMTSPRPATRTVEPVQQFSGGVPVDASDGRQEPTDTQHPFSYRSEIFSTVELDWAIEHHKVTLDHIVMARYLSQELHNPRSSPEERVEYNQRMGRLVHCYKQSRKWRILDHRFCSYIPAEVVLAEVVLEVPGPVTRFGKFVATVLRSRRPTIRSSVIDIAYLPEATKTTDLEIVAAIWKCHGLYLRAAERRGGRRSLLVQDIYSLIVALFSLADAQAVPDRDHAPAAKERAAKERAAKERAAKAQAIASAEIKRLDTSIKDAAVAEARHDYLLGMFAGVIFLVALMGVLFGFTPGKPTIHSVLGVMAAGGLGATLSVMCRLTANRLRVDTGAGAALIRLAGSFRPLVGAIFGLALYIFIEADLFPISPTITGQKLTYFYLSAAFLAGFSERLAQDAITKAGAVISSDGSPAEGSHRKA